MANAKYLMANRSTLSAVPSEKEMTANELLAAMCANSATNRLKLYSDDVESISGAQFWVATSTSAGENNWLEEAVFPNCTSVGYRSFYRCSGLKRLILPSLTSCTYGSSFQYLSSIEELDIGNVVSTSAISLTGANVNGFTIYIGDGYYSGSSSACLLNIPTNVIGPVKIVFKGSKVGKYVLQYLTHPVDVEIRNSVTSLKDFCFTNCKGLTSMTLPDSVTSIGGACFYGCTGLTSITSLAIVPPSVGIGSFNEVDKSIPVYVPEESVSSYKAANEWSAFTNIQAIP